MKKTLHLDDSHIVGESDKGTRVALYHVWNVERTDDCNYGVYFFHEERLGGYDKPSKEEIWEAYNREGCDDEWTRRMIDEEDYFVERVYII